MRIIYTLLRFHGHRILAQKEGFKSWPKNNKEIVFRQKCCWSPDEMRERLHLCVFCMVQQNCKKLRAVGCHIGPKLQKKPPKREQLSIIVVQWTLIYEKSFKFVLSTWNFGVRVSGFWEKCRYKDRMSLGNNMSTYSLHKLYFLPTVHSWEPIVRVSPCPCWRRYDLFLTYDLCFVYHNSAYSQLYI